MFKINPNHRETPRIISLSAQERCLATAALWWTQEEGLQQHSNHCGSLCESKKVLLLLVFIFLLTVYNYNRLFGAHLCDVHFGYLQNPTGVLNMFYLLLHKSRKRWDASQPSTHNISQYFSKPYLASKKVQWNSQWNSWLYLSYYLSYTPAFVHTVWVLAVNFYLDSFLRLKQSQPILRRWILRYWFIYWIVNCT